MIDPNQPAFPELHIHHWRDQDRESQEIADNMVPRWMGGLTKRELFVAMAMQGLSTSGEYRDFNDIAADAVNIADALIAELSKEPKQ